MVYNSNPLPTTLYESLSLKLIAVLDLTENPEGAATLQAKQALLEATNDFKSAMNQAKELAIALPGGELLTGDQDEVIDMLHRLRDRKREKLSQFSKRVLSSNSMGTQMEVDSTASTPNNA